MIWQQLSIVLLLLIYFIYSRISMFGKWLSLSILVLLFGSAFSFIELSLERYSPFFIAFFRVFVAFIILSIICIKRNVKFDFVSDNFFSNLSLACKEKWIIYLAFRCFSDKISWRTNSLKSKMSLPSFYLLLSIQYTAKNTTIKIWGFIIEWEGCLWTW